MNLPEKKLTVNKAENLNYYLYAAFFCLSLGIIINHLDTENSFLHLVKIVFLGVNLILNGIYLSKRARMRKTS